MRKNLSLLVLFVVAVIFLTLNHRNDALAQGGIGLDSDYISTIAPIISPSTRSPSAVSATEPLSGNYRLVPWDEIVVVWDSKSYDAPALDVQVLDVNETLGNPVAQDVPHSEAISVGTTSMDIASGDFSGNGQNDVVTVWRDGQTVKMNVCVADRETLALSCDESTVAQGVSGGPVLAETGDFDGDGKDEWLLMWQGKIRVYTFDFTSGEITIVDELAISATDIAVGDFNPLNDTTDEIIVTGRTSWNSSQGTIDVKIYALCAGIITLQDVHTFSFSPSTDPMPFQLLGSPVPYIVSDNLVGNIADDVVLMFSYYEFTPHTNPDLYRFYTQVCPLIVDDDYHFSAWAECVTLPAYTTDFDLATGDFNADGLAELVIADADNDTLEIFAYEAFSLTSQVSLDVGIGYGLALSVGDLNRDAVDEIALASKSGGEMFHHLVLNLYEVSPTLTTITQKGSYSKIYTSNCVLPLCDPNDPGRIAITIADLDNDGFRVGPPTYYREVDVLRPLAIINEPPKHYDVIDGVEHNLSKVICNPQMSNCGYAAYETEVATTTKLMLTTNRDWGVSANLSVGGSYAGASIKTSMTGYYGEHFENTHGSSEIIKFTERTWAANDDVIYHLEVDYDVWEYPVYTDTTNIVAGYLLVVFPGVPKVARIDGKNLSSFYVPNHENNNLLSYPTDKPSDIGSNFYTELTRNYVSATAYEVEILRTELAESSVQTSNTWGVEASVEASAGGSFGGLGMEISTKVSGNYGQGEMSLHQLSIQETTKIHIYVPPLEVDPDQAFYYTYWIDPYVYWSTNGNYLVVDYAAGPNTEDVSIWWQETYGSHPDPTFNLPWKYSGVEDYIELTKEIFFDYTGNTPQVGEPVTITARVRNYSLMGAYNVKVRFYQGDPDSGGVQIGTDQVIGQLNPRDVATVQTTFTFATDVPNYWEIYAVVDPDNTITEIHEDFNRAYALLMRRTTYHPDLLPESLAFDSSMPTSGDTLHITATIKAVTDTATFVAVEFWDGAPGQGSVIGGVVLPEILEGQTVLACTTWDTTGQFGAHYIWVNVTSMSGEEQQAYTTNNAMSASLSFTGAGFPVYLPLLVKTVNVRCTCE